ncbi:hypothetical protein HJG60_008546 [Phyllostomus discolor]|uniref:Uncharacterized protein n=1 Tax=Phyllostomus discolor TaxID=89673 RepID=A0A833YX36_9CHIR|nr:hypothetical protein HJG60_008546 [Phyllostomus discolor]
MGPFLIPFSYKRRGVQICRGRGSVRPEPHGRLWCCWQVIVGHFPRFPSSSSPLLVRGEPRWCGVKTPLSIKLTEYVSFCSLRFSGLDLSPGLNRSNAWRGPGSVSSMRPQTIISVLGPPAALLGPRRRQQDGPSCSNSLGGLEGDLCGRLFRSEMSLNA